MYRSTVIETGYATSFQFNGPSPSYGHLKFDLQLGRVLIKENKK